MNRKLAKKMAVIKAQFSQANQKLPIAQDRSEIKPIYCGKYKGVRVHAINVWNVSSREYWKFCKA